MTTIPLTARQRAHQEILEQINKRALFHRIDRIPKLTGCRIMHYDGKRLQELRTHPKVCMANKLTALIKPIEINEKVVGQNFEITRQDKSDFYSELLSTGLSCSAAMLSMDCCAR